MAVVEAASPSVVSDYVALTKPRIVFLVVLTTAAGFWLGARASGRPLDWVATLLGTALVAAGASAWNQAMEGSRDSRMRRTARWPVPQGRVGMVSAACVRGVDRSDWPGDAGGGATAGGVGRACDVFVVCGDLHAAQAGDDIEHGDWGGAGGVAAGDWLGGGDGRAGD